MHYITYLAHEIYKWKQLAVGGFLDTESVS